MENAIPAQSQPSVLTTNGKRPKDHLGALPTELPELVAEHADNASLKALRLVNRNVYARARVPYAERSYRSFSIFTKTEQLDAVSSMLSTADFVDTISTLCLRVSFSASSKSATEVSMRLRAVLTKMNHLETISLGLGEWPDNLQQAQGRDYSDHLLLAIRAAVHFKGLRAMQNPDYCLFWGKEHIVRSVLNTNTPGLEYFSTHQNEAYMCGK